MTNSSGVSRRLTSCVLVVTTLGVMAWTSRSPALTIASTTTATTTQAATTDESRAVLAVVQRLFDAMRSRDTAAFRDVFEPSARLVGMRTRQNGEQVVQVLPWDRFGAFMASDNRAGRGSNARGRRRCASAARSRRCGPNTTSTSARRRATAAWTRFSCSRRREAGRSSRSPTRTSPRGVRPAETRSAWCPRPGCRRRSAPTSRRRASTASP